MTSIYNKPSIDKEKLLSQPENNAQISNSLDDIKPLQSKKISPNDLHIFSPSTVKLYTPTNDDLSIIEVE